MNTQDDNMKPKNKPWIMIFVVIFLAVVIGVGATMINNKDDSQTATSQDDQAMDHQEEMVQNKELKEPEKVYETLKIGLMTDLQARSSTGKMRSDRIIKEEFMEPLNTFLSHMTEKFQPDFLVQNGDIIEGTGRDGEVGSGELRSIKRIHDEVGIPVKWVIGNHEVRAVTKEEYLQALEIDYLYKYEDIGDYRIVIIDSNFDEQDRDIIPGDYYTRGKVSQEQMQWLEEEALKTDKKKIVFIHHPPVWNIPNKENDGLPLNALELRSLFAKNDVTAVFAGHIEQLYTEEVDGVKYYVLPGVVKSDEYKGTYYTISINGDNVELEMFSKPSEEVFEYTSQSIEARS